MAVTASSLHRPPASEYAALLAGAGLFDRSEHGKLAVTGPDAADFLDSLLSNDIQALGEGSGCDATLLTHKGRMLAVLRVLHIAGEHWLDTERICLQALFDALHQYRVGYAAELHKRTLEQGLLSLIGPRAQEVLGTDVPVAEHASVAAMVAGTAVTLVRTDVGVDVICAADSTAAIAQELERSGAQRVGEDAVECLRVERGRPRFGPDIDEQTMPQEAGLHTRAVSYSKGCYVGQETVARLYWKGRPNRHLRGLILSAPAEPGASLRLDTEPVGALGSVAISPALGAIALALVRRKAAIGDVLTLDDSDATAVVCDLPFSS